MSHGVSVECSYWSRAYHTPIKCLKSLPHTLRYFSPWLSPAHWCEPTSYADVRWNGCRQGSSFCSNWSVNSKDGFRLMVVPGMVRNTASGVRLVARVVRSRLCREEQWLSLRRWAVNAPMSKHDFVAMITVTPVADADPHTNRCLPSHGTTATGSCRECSEPTWSNTWTTKTPWSTP